MRTSPNFVNGLVGVLAKEFHEESVIDKPSTRSGDQTAVLIVKPKLAGSIKPPTRTLIAFIRLPSVLDLAEPAIDTNPDTSTYIQRRKS
ncbi:hypothetical protein AWM79_14660 [Pseudomonas agarici]|uniref:Uncharacterized protein n=2 Tax=Pseudomonas agarici TaxID=46677 RepID=A0A0X1T360_PSEAA|nr:hypothetical protein [Pseudomonas agarici]AMB86478.1 hypothetical protein AWM79_14660 [Pseudomonas agarici]NWC09326.1 hypothetical protein [Pseudomonas agarici]